MQRRGVPDLEERFQVVLDQVGLDLGRPRRRRRRAGHVGGALAAAEGKKSTLRNKIVSEDGQTAAGRFWMRH